MNSHARWFSWIRSYLARLVEVQMCCWACCRSILITSVIGVSCPFQAANAAPNPLVCIESVASGHQLFSINPSNGVATPLSQPFRFDSSGFAPGTFVSDSQASRCYAVSSNNFLYSFDLKTGQRLGAWSNHSCTSYREKRQTGRIGVRWSVFD